MVVFAAGRASPQCWLAPTGERGPPVETEAGDFPMPGFKFPHLRNEVVFLPCLSHESRGGQLELGGSEGLVDSLILATLDDALEPTVFLPSESLEETACCLAE